jgi:hypothetical protein
MHPRHRPLVLLAWLNVLVHVCAVALAAVALQPGSPLMEFPDRLAYLAEHPMAWSLAWGAWMLCALALVAFLACLIRAVPEPAGGLRLALLVAASGAAVDLFCDVIQITALPFLASQAPVPIPVFLALERIAGAGGLIVANGAYSVAVLLATLALRGTAGINAGVVPVGLAVTAAGFVLVVAGFLDSALLAAVGTLPTIGLFCVWTILVARSVRGSGKMA